MLKHQNQQMGKKKKKQKHIGKSQRKKKRNNKTPNITYQQNNKTKHTMTRRAEHVNTKVKMGGANIRAAVLDPGGRRAASPAPAWTTVLSTVSDGSAHAHLNNFAQSRCGDMHEKKKHNPGW